MREGQWTSQGAPKLARLLVGPLAHSLGTSPTDFCPLGTENPVMHSFVQKKLLEHLLCASPVVGTALSPCTGKMESGNKENFKVISGSRSSTAVNMYLAFPGHGVLFLALHMYLLILVTGGRDEETEILILEMRKLRSRSVTFQGHTACGWWSRDSNAASRSLLLVTMM